MEAATMSKNMMLLVFVLACFFAHASHQYTLKLVHMDSPVSPYYIANDTLELRDKRWMELSRRRFKHYSADTPYLAPLYADPTGLMFAELGLGKPSIPQLVVIDTGSSFMWIVCEKTPYMSGNYTCEDSMNCTRVYCIFDECKHVPNGNFDCEFYNYCMFFIKYVSRLYVSGTVVTDTARFDGVDLDHDLLFGCGKVEMQLPFGGYLKGTGIMGLMNTQGSVASQFGWQFSYCIGELSNPYYQFNVLFLGDDAVLEGNWTPILNFSSKVYVSLQKIIVGGVVLDVDPVIFKGNKYKGGTIVDSGSPYSYLTDEAYMMLRAQLNDSIPASPDEPDYEEESALGIFCRNDLKKNNVPLVIFVFDRLLTLNLGFSSLFHRTGLRRHCLSIMPASSVFRDQSLTLIGLHAQQQYSVGFDYKKMRLYLWASNDCEMLLT